MVSLSPAGDLGKQGEGQGDPARDIFPPLKHLVGTDLQEGGVVQYQPAELLFRRDPQQLLVFLIPAGDKMALVALLHDLSVQITGQLLIQGGDERVLQGKAVDDVAEAVFQELTQKRRLWLTGVACQVGDHPVGVSGDVPQGIRYALSPPSFVMSCSFSLIPRTFSCEGALLQYLYSILVLSVFKYCEAYVFIIRMLRCLFSVHFLF